MKVQVPGDVVVKEIFYSHKFANGYSGEFVEGHEVGFSDGIAYANEQLATPPSTKRPFFNDGDIHAEELQQNTLSGNPSINMGFLIGAKWARDKYEAMLAGAAVDPDPTKWQPVVGQKCVFWNEGDTVAHPGIYREQGSHKFVHYPTWKLAGFDSYMYCAALETLDEIGKPPSYFIERGRCTV